MGGVCMRKFGTFSRGGLGLPGYQNLLVGGKEKRPWRAPRAPKLTNGSDHEPHGLSARFWEISTRLLIDFPPGNKNNNFYRPR